MYRAEVALGAASQDRVRDGDEPAYLFGAVYPERGVNAGLVMPFVDTAAMTARLAEIGLAVAPGAHAVFVLDGAGRQASAILKVPDNTTLLSLPPVSLGGVLCGG